MWTMRRRVAQLKQWFDNFFGCLVKLASPIIAPTRFCRAWQKSNDYYKHPLFLVAITDRISARDRA